MGKLDGKVAVITAATSGMALATAKLFVQEGAYVFITGRRKDKLDEAVKAIGRNVTGIQGDASDLADLDRLYDTVKKKKGKDADDDKDESNWECPYCGTDNPATRNTCSNRECPLYRRAGRDWHKN